MTGATEYVAAIGAVAVLVQSGVIRSLLASNKSLTRAVISKTTQELVVLEHAAAKNEAIPNNVPWRSPAETPYDDDDDIVPMGLGG